MVRDDEQVARLAAIGELVPAFRERARAHDDGSAYPADNVADLRRLGLVALTASEDVGGLGLWSDGRFAPYYELLEALAYADTSTAQLIQVHSHAMGYLSRHATPDQRERYLRPIVEQGQMMASVGSETGPRGTVPGVYSSELERDGDGWRLTCVKHFASLAPSADWLLLWVAVPGSEPYHKRTVTVMVPRDAPEVTLVDDWDALGMRPTVSWGVRIDGLHVPDHAIIGAPGAWVDDDPRTFTLAFAANHVGLARAAVDFAVDWVAQRDYLASSDMAQVELGTIAAQVYGARSAVRAAALAWDEGRWARAEAESLMAVHLAKKAALDATREAFDICGARTTYRLYPLETWYRDARTLTLHVRDDIQMRELGRALIAGGEASKVALDTSVIAARNA